MPVEQSVTESCRSVFANVAVQDFGASRMSWSKLGNICNYRIDHNPALFGVSVGFKKKVAEEKWGCETDDRAIFKSSPRSHLQVMDTKSSFFGPQLSCRRTDLICFSAVRTRALTTSLYSVFSRSQARPT